MQEAAHVDRKRTLVSQHAQSARCRQAVEQGLGPMPHARGTTAQREHEAGKRVSEEGREPDREAQQDQRQGQSSEDRHDSGTDDTGAPPEARHRQTNSDAPARQHQRSPVADRDAGAGNPPLQDGDVQHERHWPPCQGQRDHTDEDAPPGRAPAWRRWQRAVVRRSIDSIAHGRSGLRRLAVAWNAADASAASEDTLPFAQPPRSP